MIAFVPLKNAGYVILFKNLRLLFDAVTDSCHNLITGFLLLVAEAEVILLRLKIVCFCVIEPAVEPDRRRSGCYAVKQIAVISAPESEQRGE